MAMINDLIGELEKAELVGSLVCLLIIPS